jgi:hypothetical protein
VPRPTRTRPQVAPVDGVGGEPEEVEVARSPLDLAASDQRCSTGEREPVRLVEPGDYRGNLLLERAQHLRGAAMTLEPSIPRLPNPRREDELVPEVEQLVGVDVIANVLWRSQLLAPESGGESELPAWRRSGCRGERQPDSAGFHACSFVSLY